MVNYSYITASDSAAIEQFYQQYRTDPDSVDMSWRRFFEGFEFAKQAGMENLAQPSEFFEKESKVINLISAYRTRGHLFTKTNPVRHRRQYDDPLTLESFGLKEQDLETVFQAGSLLGLGSARLRDIVALLEETYCGSVAVEFRYIRDPQVVNWLQSRMESSRNRREFDAADRQDLLEHLTQTVIFERFMHERFVGQKRFSLEGVEAIIPALDAIIEKGALQGIKEFVIGMAHRGRLSVLANILGKPAEQIFTEFSGRASPDDNFEGDVKYHLGHTAVKQSHDGRPLRVSLVPNPSHLEAVGPVLEGLVRARIDEEYSGRTEVIAPILIHGDASIAGQGVVYEVAQMSQLRGYGTSGTIHIVLNNQVGFTTNYTDARSSTYCTDVGKITLSPVFHVNGDDAEAVVYVTELALEFRQQFKRDVFIDILGYRKWGHNEGDEPRFTQPQLYNLIANHPDPMSIYRTHLISKGLMDEDQARQVEADYRARLTTALLKSKEAEPRSPESFLARENALLRYAEKSDFERSPQTGVAPELLDQVAESLSSLPDGRRWFAKIQKIFADRRRNYYESHKLDWAMAEMLAYGSLLSEGHSVRISGQDCQRGTFAHRHAVVKIEDSEEEYLPLAGLARQNASFSVYNSPLNEYGVLGFEYGYSLVTPGDLTVWEAQFGDFSNVAQPIIDQFISCGERKWRQMSGLVMLLPHGYEGQGSEHSSARLERYLQMCAELNMQVLNCSTPASLFHTLRRQLAWPFRKPLVVMTPKSLLRHPECVSLRDELLTGTGFQEVLDDKLANPAEVERVVICTGKIYYDLLERRRLEQRNDVALVRLEQIYPLPGSRLEAVCGRYKAAKRILWVQEEPENMGAWRWLKFNLKWDRLEGIFRQASSVPATGFHEKHKLEQKLVLDQAFGERMA